MPSTLKGDKNAGLSDKLDEQYGNPGKYDDKRALEDDKTFRELTDPEHFDKDGENPKYSSDKDDGPDYNPEERKNGRRRFKAKYSKPLIAATAIGGASTIAWFSFISGPGQFIHAAQLLQQFHFTSNEDASTSRVTRLWRYAKNPDDPGKRKLSTFGNRLADAMDAKALANGFEFANKSPSGVARNLTVDTNKYGKSVPETIAEFEKAGYKAVDVGNGVVDVDIDRFTVTADRKMMKIVAKGSGVNRIVGAVGFRKVKIRNFIGLSAIQRLEKKAEGDVKNRYNEWQQKRTADLTTAEPGDLPRGQAEKTEDTDNDGTKDSPKPEAEDASKTSFKKPDIKTKVAGGVGVVGLVTGLGCAAVSISDNVDTWSYELVQLPLMKTAMEMMSYAGMIMANQADEDTWEELGYASEAFTQKAKEADPATGTDAVKFSTWTDSEDFKTELGESTEGSTPPPKEVYIDSEGNVVSQVADSIPGIRGACGAATSLPGQVVFFVVDVIATGGLVGPLAGEAVSALFADDILDAILGWLKGDPLDLAGVAGANYGSYLNFGTFYSANESAIGQGGRALSRPEVAELKLKERQELINLAKEKGLFYRTLDKNNPRSLASSFARQAPDSASQMATTLFTSPFKIMSSFKSFMPGMTTYAAGTGFDYGIPKYGFSLTELENDDYDNPYDNANEYFDDEERLAELRDKWGEKCFGVKIFEDTGKIEFSQGKPYKDIIDDCPMLAEGATQTETFTRYRIYVLDTVTAASGACYGGDEEACTAIGFNQSGSAPQQNTSSATAQENATILVGLIDSGGISGDSRYTDQIRAVAAGDNTCRLDADILAILVELSKSHTFNISSFNRRCTEVLTASGEGSLHYRDGGGYAVDLSVVDKFSSSGGKETDLALLAKLLPLMDATGREGQLGQKNCRSTPLANVPASIREVNDTCNHIHFGLYPE